LGEKCDLKKKQGVFKPGNVKSGARITKVVSFKHRYKPTKKGGEVKAT